MTHRNTALQIFRIFVFALAVMTSSTSVAEMLSIYPQVWKYDEQNIGQIEIDIVRGHAEIIRRPGPVTISIRNLSAPDPKAAVWVEDRQEANRLYITDRFPMFPVSGHRECLPVGPRGNFWVSKARLLVIIHAPEHIDIQLNIMENNG